MPLIDSGIQPPEDTINYWSLYDEMAYTVTSSIPYETEGTFALAAGVGAVIQFTSGNVAGNRARLNHSTTQLAIDPTKMCYQAIRCAFAQQINQTIFVGMYGALPTAANPPVEPNEGFYFRRKDTASEAHWFAVCRAGGVESAVDLGATVAQDTLQHTYLIVLKKFNQTITASFYIDGTFQTSISTNISTVVQTFGAVCVTLEAVAHVVAIDAFQTIAGRVASAQI